MAFARAGADEEALATLEDLGGSPAVDPRTLYGLSLRALVLALGGDLPEAVRDLEVIEASPRAAVRARRGGPARAVRSSGSRRCASSRSASRRWASSRRRASAARSSSAGWVTAPTLSVGAGTIPRCFALR